MRKHKIGGIPIVSDTNKLIGIVTNRDLRFEHYVDKTLGSIMTRDNLITAKEKTSLEEAEKILQQYKVEKLPIVNKDRSEEHTSELQSRGHLVCRLLLEKKKCSRQLDHN